ncbi:MAG: diaminopimelate decarboxylase [Bacillota bacterium]|nr:diaminopimelate decarboxylase [Bacillota bacterium]
MSILEIGGVPVDRIAEKCGTPVYVFDEAKIEKQLADYKRYFVSDMFDTDIVYASKAFTCRAMIQKLVEAGACIDVVSGGELFIAEQGGMPMENVYFHGNNKTGEELEQALDAGVGTIVLDNLTECGILADLAEHKRKRINAMLRINPGVEAHTHEYIMTGGSNSKFGISINEKDAIAELVKRAGESEYVDFKGFHSHIGSQIFEDTAFMKATEVLISFYAEMEREYGISCSWLSLGGGFGIRYTDADKPMSVEDMCRSLIGKCEDVLKKEGVSMEKIMIEPGRSIAGEAGYTLYTVGYQKTAGDRHYIFVDGGMGDNIRPALYQAEYDADIANRMGEEKEEEYYVAGKYCESGDILIKQIMLPKKIEKGDLLVIYSTGAYGYSMASCYNGIGRAPVVFAKDGKARTVLKRETYRDLVRLETDEEVNI